MPEQRIIEQGDLHDGQGRLAQVGYATRLLLRYDRARIAAPKYRIKEWDYYLINDDAYAVALTVGDLGYMGLLSASVIDLRRGASQTESVMTPLPLGRFHLPSSSEEGITEFENNRVLFRFQVADGQRTIHVQFDRFSGKDSLVVDAVLDNEPADSMVIATPWPEDPKAFYYNQKIVGMNARGSFKVGRRLHGFRPDDSFGLLDWGRGVWTRDNTWYWACAQGWQDGKGGRSDGHIVGMNLGYGFGDTSAASENMVFIDGTAHKFGVVDFGIPELPTAASANTIAQRYDLMQPWHVHDEQGDLDLEFTPLHDRIDFMNFRIIISDQHQVFGEFNGTVNIDGKPFTIAGLKGSAEVIHNRY